MLIAKSKHGQNRDSIREIAQKSLRFDLDIFDSNNGTRENFQGNFNRNKGYSHFKI